MAISSVFDNGQEQLDWIIVFLASAGIAFAMYKRWYFQPLYTVATIYFFIMMIKEFPSFLKFRFWFRPDAGKGAFHDLLPMDAALGNSFSYAICFGVCAAFMFHVNLRRVQAMNMEKNKR